MSVSGLNGDLSDTESFADDLSPSDGYFNPRQPSQSALVQDPSLPSPEEGKAREAREEEEANPVNGRRAEHVQASRYTPQSPQLQRSISYEEETYSDRSPLIPIAPPAYEAATAGNQYRPLERGFMPGNGGGSAGYQTISQGLFDRQDEPQSMGGPVDNETSSSESRWFRRSSKLLGTCCSVGAMGKILLILRIVLVLLAMGVGIGFVVNAVSSFKSKKDTSTPHFHVPSEERSCSTNAYPEELHFRLRPRDDGADNLTFWQLSSDPGDERPGLSQEVQVIGEVRVNRQPEKSGNNVTWIHIDSNVSDPELLRLTNVQVDDDRVFVKTPNRVWNWKSNSACMSIVVTIWIPAGAQYNAVDIETQYLDIVFSPAVKVTAKELTLGSLHGNVLMPAKAAEIDSRRTIVDLDTGSIKGSFSLFDLLLLGTKSGDVKVDVIPQEVNPMDPQPANLTVNTVTGKVNVSSIIENDNVYKIPERDYRVTMESKAGAISGSLLHGSSTALKSGSGGITAILYPIVNPNNESKISTEAEFGNTHLTVMPSLIKPDYPLRRLFSNHNTSSGSIDLRYPDTWEGDIMGRYLSGSVHIDFGDARIVYDGRKGRSWHDFAAVKGKGWGVMSFQDVSGSVNIRATPEINEE